MQTARDGYENVLQLKINEKLQNLPKHKNIYSKNGGGNIKKNVKIAKPHLIKRVKTKLFALQMLLAPNVAKNCSNKHKINDDNNMDSIRLYCIIDNILILQHTVLNLSYSINNISRLALLFVFFQSALAIIFNTYNMVMFYLKLAFDAEVPMTLSMGTLFYVNLIITAAIDILTTIIGFSLVYGAMERTIKMVNKLLLYCQDAAARIRLAQGIVLINSELRRYSVFNMFHLDGSYISAMLSATFTYILILVQYSDLPVQLQARNSTNRLNSASNSITFSK